MAGFTKGDWKVWNLEDDEKGWTIQLGNDGRFIARTCDDTEEDLANARLTVAAVNACQKVNKDNPQAVAEALPAMHKALKQAQEGKGDWRGMIDLALALADGRVE